MYSPFAFFLPEDGETVDRHIEEVTVYLLSVHFFAFWWYCYCIRV